MFSGGSTQQWLNVILYSIFMLILFTAIAYVSVKISNYYIQEQDKRKKLNQLRKNYHAEKNIYSFEKNTRDFSHGRFKNAYTVNVTEYKTN